MLPGDRLSPASSITYRIVNDCVSYWKWKRGLWTSSFVVVYGREDVVGVNFTNTIRYMVDGGRW